MTKTIKIEGMSCNHCAMRVTKALNDIDGLNAKVNLEKQEASIILTKEIDDQLLITAIEDAGYKVVSIKK